MKRIMHCTTARRLVVAATLAGMALVTYVGAQENTSIERDYGVCDRVPWSGYWWQYDTGGLTEPLLKYDLAARSRAAIWEHQEHVAAASPKWFGHCHGWAAASVTEAEPLAPRTVNDVQFSVGDLKGILTACHAQDVATSYGDRFGDGIGSEASDDLPPDELWRLLQMYVKKHRIPLILDLDAGEEIWNYPVYEYQVEYLPRGDGWYECHLQLTVADNEVDPSFLGTCPLIYAYSFVARFDAGGIVMGSGRWTGDSMADHPDFAWYPLITIPENPELDLTQVARILGQSLSDSRSAPDAETQDTPETSTSAVRANHLASSRTEPLATDSPGAVATTADTQAPALTLPAALPVSDGETEDVITLEPVESWLTAGSQFRVDLVVDRGDGGKYDLGSTVSGTVRSERAGALYLFEIAGNLTRQILPKPGTQIFVEAGVTYHLPSALAPANQGGSRELQALVVTAESSSDEAHFGQDRSTFFVMFDPAHSPAKGKSKVQRKPRVK